MRHLCFCRNQRDRNRSAVCHAVRIQWAYQSLSTSDATFAIGTRGSHTQNLGYSCTVAGSACEAVYQAGTVFPHLHTCKSFHEVDDDMVDQVGRNCVGSAVRMTIKDCHKTCALCLGQNHASLAREILSFCINCFILAARSTEADSCKHILSTSGKMSKRKNAGMK